MHDDADIFKLLLWCEETGNIRYLICQLEIGELGTPHLQGYLETSRPVERNWVENAFPLGFAHWEFARKGSKACARYCSKEATREDGPWEYGKSISGQGARADLDHIGDRIKDGEKIRTIAIEHPGKYFQYGKMWEKFQQLVCVPVQVNPDLQVWLFHGDTGVGKSRFVYDHFDEVFKKPQGGLWFDGYQGEETILLEEFSGAASKVTLFETLDILDIYRVQLQTKGGFTWRRCSVICVCTNVHPKYWYRFRDREDCEKALYRRFTHVMRWSKGSWADGGDRWELYLRGEDVWKTYFGV